MEQAAAQLIARGRGHGLELTIMLAGAPAIATVLLGFGRPVYAVAAVGLQVLVICAYGPVLWRTGRLASVLWLAPALVLYWVGAFVVLPRVASRLTPGVALACGIAGAAIYLAIAVPSTHRLSWAAVGFPVAIGAAFGFLAAMADAAAKPVPPVAPAGQPLARAPVRLTGPQGAEAGRSLARTGDLTGRGGAGLAVGFPNPGTTSGGVMLLSAAGLHGHAELTGSAGSDVVRLLGRPGENAGFSVVGLGDVNGDGKPDLAVGAPQAANTRGDVAGAVYVIWGGALGAHGTATSLPRLARTHGFMLYGGYLGDSAGYSIADAGDVNGDGLDDIVIGVPRFDRTGAPSGLGAVYVIWGKRTTTPVDLARVGAHGTQLGYRIVSARGLGTIGTSVANAGDVNGDGVPDLVIGQPSYYSASRPESGRALVVFGQRTQPSIDADHVGTPGDTSGLLILGAHGGEGAGTSVAGIGDVNGDGLSDVAVGAPFSSWDGRIDNGSVYVVYGRRTAGTIDLRTLGHGRPNAGYVIQGAGGGTCSTGLPCGDELGTSLAAAGDLNGDGIPDLLAGAPDASVGGRQFMGSAFAVLGQRTHSVVDLARITSAGNGIGARVDGVAGGDGTGLALAPLGRAGDRLLFAVGAPRANVDAGTVYGVAGRHASRLR
jgi:hypothetical protein